VFSYLSEPHEKTLLPQLGHLTELSWQHFVAAAAFVIIIIISEDST
jgi:hypothetical protein